MITHKSACSLVIRKRETISGGYIIELKDGTYMGYVKKLADAKFVCQELARWDWGETQESGQKVLREVGSTICSLIGKYIRFGHRHQVSNKLLTWEEFLEDTRERYREEGWAINF